MEPYSECGIETGITGDPGCYGRLKRVELIPQIALSGAAWDSQEVEATRHQRRQKSQFCVCCIHASMCAWKSDRVCEPGSMMYFTCPGSVSYFALQECLTRQVMGQRLTVIGTDGQVVQSHTVLELSPPSATVHARLHIRYIKRAASLRSSRPLSHTHTCMLTCYCSEAPAPPLVCCACVRLCWVVG